MTNQIIEHTPERRLSDGLDYYKFPMGQQAFEKYPDADVTFTMKNRDSDYPLSKYVDTDELEARLEAIQTLGFTDEEIGYLESLETRLGTPRFSDDYLNYLSAIKMSEIAISNDPQTGDLHIETTGKWPAVSLWETVVMSEVNELYYQNLMKDLGLNVEDVWKEGDRRLDEKIAKLQNTNVKFADFGTRRRFSAAWHSHVVERLSKELPDNFIGTSNPWLAYKFDLTPIGTYAHEMPMAYAALASKEGRNPLDGHTQMMQDWFDRYGVEGSIGLTDTFTSDFFFSDFTPEQAAEWRGLRHDSGDPTEFGERVIQFYKERGIDPKTKTLIFSDGLDIDTILELQETFEGRIDILFGWGTTLMNDLGLRPNNFVMKATSVNGEPTVKLSDVAGKHTGPADEVSRYADLAAARAAVERSFDSSMAVTA
jgi:nicotinate phosphoribosyltransferase